MAHHGRLTLRLQYWHQSPVGESAQHSALFLSFITAYLAILRRRSPSHYPWDCRQVPLTPGSGNPRYIVPVQVSDLLWKFNPGIDASSRSTLCINPAPMQAAYPRRNAGTCGTSSNRSRRTQSSVPSLAAQ